MSQVHVNLQHGMTVLDMADHDKSESLHLHLVAAMNAWEENRIEMTHADLALGVSMFVATIAQNMAMDVSEASKKPLSDKKVAGLRIQKAHTMMALMVMAVETEPVLLQAN